MGKLPSRGWAVNPLRGFLLTIWERYAKLRSPYPQEGDGRWTKWARYVAGTDERVRAAVPTP
jgi:hypothetical protein